MVNKPRWNELKRRLGATPEPPHPRVFSEPQWQAHVSIWYLLYRWLIFLCWSALIVCSISETGSYKPEKTSETWLIYLTHWDLCLGLVQSLVGAFLATNRARLQRRDGFHVDTLSFGIIEKTYWFLYTVTSSVAVGVTITYWCTIYDPRLHVVDPLNIMMHVCNSIVMLIDCLVVGVPHRLQHFWWCLAFVAIYLSFTLIYYLLGGVDKHGHHYIYKPLDWQKPGYTILVCLGGLVFVAFVHCTLCLLVQLRSRISVKIGNRTKNELPGIFEKKSDLNLQSVKSPAQIV